LYYSDFAIDFYEAIVELDLKSLNDSIFLWLSLAKEGLSGVLSPVNS